MSRPLKNERARPVYQDEQVDRSSTNFSSVISTRITSEAVVNPYPDFEPSSLTGSWETESTQVPRTAGVGSHSHLPYPSLTGPTPQEATAYPSILASSSSFTGTLAPGSIPQEEMASPSTGMPSGYFTGASVSREVKPPPRYLRYGDSLYQRVGLHPEEEATDLSDTPIHVTAVPNLYHDYMNGPPSLHHQDHMGGLPYLDHHHDYLPRLDTGYRRSRISPRVSLVDRFVTSDAQDLDHDSYRQGVEEQNLSRAQQDTRSESALVQDEAAEVYRGSDVLNTSETSPQVLTSTHAHLTGAPPTKPTVRKPKQSRFLREFGPHNDSPKSGSEDALEMPQPITRGPLQPALPKKKRNTRTGREHNESNESPDSGNGQELRSTTASSAQLTSPPKPRRKSRMVRQLEPHNESPESESEAALETPQPITRRSTQSALAKQKRNHSPESDPDHEQEARRSRTARSSQPASSRPQRKSLLLREIAPHNESPERESDPDLEIVWDAKDQPLTRNARQVIVSNLIGKPVPPKKDLNLRRLMLGEFSGMPKGTKTFYAEDDSNMGSSSNPKQPKLRRKTKVNVEDDGEEESLPKAATTSAQSYPQPMSTRPTMPAQSEESSEMGQEHQKAVAESTWSMWESQKAKINELTRAPRYTPQPSQQEMDAQGRQKPAYHATAEIPKSLQGAFYTEEGLHVFTPTVDSFLGFDSFLREVEEVAGRKMGVVKVVIPSERLASIPRLFGGTVPRSSVMETMEVNLSLNENTAEDKSKIYNMLMTDGSTSIEPNDLLRKIQRDRDHVAKKRAVGAEAINDDKIWKEYYTSTRLTEARMIRQNETHERDVSSALNQLVTPALRAALKCGDPRIDSLLGNRFMSSRSDGPGMNQSSFHIAGGPGPLYPLHTNKYAAYSLNYHHAGAPRILTVTAPEHHEKVEEFMYIAQGSGILSGRPPTPPPCSQFVAHKPMYVPQGTLESHGVKYTQVVQCQGELVITFPYAYHQAYAPARNITEEIMYFSERCEVFHRDNLYQHCSPNCAAGQPDDFNWNDVLSSLFTRRKSGLHHRSSLEPSPAFFSPRPSREPSASLHPSTRASKAKPSTPRPAAHMTSNPYEPNIRDPAHAVGAPSGPDNDEGSPIGGHRPRDLATAHPPMRHEGDASKRRNPDDDASEEAPRKHRRR